MKHDKKPENDLKRITMLAAGTAASVAVLAGGVRIWNGFQNGNLFRPDLFVSNHDYQENQIMFPEKNDYGQTSEADTSDDNHRLERDPQADDSYGKDKPEQTEYQAAGDGNVETDLRNASNLLIAPGSSDMPNGGNDNLPQGFENSVAVATGSSNKSEQSTIQLPSGSGNGIFSGNGSSRRENADSDSDSDSGSSGRNPGGNSGNNGNNSGGGGGGGDTGGGTTPVTPDPAPTPTPDPVNPTPTPTPTPEPTPVVDPDYPNDGDKPSLPKDPPDLDIPSFPSEGITSDSSNNVSLTFNGLYYFENPGEILYNGAVLTDLKLLCSMYVYVDVLDEDGNYVSRYRITEYSDNFRVGDFPSVVDGDFTVSFYFRPNADSEWQEYKRTFEVQYAKVVVLDDDGSTLNEFFIPKKGDDICLFKSMQKYYENHEDTFGDPDDLDSLFLGWSLTEDGEPLGNWFTPEEPGRYVLYPVDRRVSVPDGLTVSASSGWDPHDNCYAGFLQRLTSAPEGAEILEVPEGIHEIGSPDNAYWGTIGINPIHDIGTLVLPNTAALLYPEKYDVLTAYQVQDDNPYFSVKGGVLYSKDGTQLLGIPQCRYDKLVVPEDVTYVKLPDGKPFKQIVFSSENPPEIDLTCISDAKLVVPKKYYLNYFVAWSQYLFPTGTLTLVADDGEAPAYDTIYDGLYSDNGQTLEYISAEYSSFFTAAASLKVVKEGATAGCTNLKQMLFSENIEVFEPYSLTGSELKTIYISALTPPTIDEKTFGDIEDALNRGLQVVVPEESLSLYQEAWKQVLGDAALKLLTTAHLSVTETENGLKYMTTDNGSVLLHAPYDTASFDDINNAAETSVFWTEIAGHAFDGCETLTALDVPETVSLIDSNAFTGCDDLQLLLFENINEITVEAAAFDPDGSLQLAAFNAWNITFSDEDLLYQISCFVPNNSWVNYKDASEMNVNLWGDSYVFKQGETGTFAYGLDIWFYDSYIIGATKDVSGAIEPPEWYNLAQFAPYALADCTNELTISSEVGSHILYVGPYAFKNSGLSGDLYIGDLYQIGLYAFSGCSQLQNVVIGTSPYYTTISGYAFYNSSLETITLPSNLKVLGSAPFSYCGNLKEVIFTGAEPPKLEALSYGVDYSFGWVDWDTTETPLVKTTLSGEAEIENYLEYWKYCLKGYTSEADLRSDKEFPYYYMFDWEIAAGSTPMTADFDFIPEFKEYVAARADAEVASTLNETIQKFYWYLNEDVPDGMLQEVVFPDIMEYVRKANGEIASSSNATKASASNALQSNKTTASNANALRSLSSHDLISEGKAILDSIHFVTKKTDTPQEEN